MGLFDKIFKNGSKDAISDRKYDKQGSKEVIFDKIYTKKGFNGKTVTYEIYLASNKEIAERFLQDKSVNKPLYYIIVDTPEGSFGRDIDGMYRER